MGKPDSTEPVFRVHRWSHLLGGLIHRTAGLWVALGNLESRQLDEQLRQVSIDRPIYVTGLARAGSTVLLEFLAAHDGVACHRARDYPSVFTPIWWSHHVEQAGAPAAPPTERAHGDGILVTRESPEALEEMLWMHFFPTAHDPAAPSLLDARTAHPAFERFYRQHLRKLLWLRGGRRYLAKNNYLVTRLAYLARLFADLRLLIPVRHPIGHVASLLRQHRRFTRGVTAEPRALHHLRRTGHFEFGPDFRPIHTGRGDSPRRIAALCESDPPRGFARYWSQIYDHLHRQLDGDPALDAAALVVRFEDLCRAPRSQLQTIAAHAELEPSRAVVERFAARIRWPDYYDRGLSEADVDAIWQEAGPVAERFGYERDG